jgi:uncharacterized protein YcbX
MSLVHVHQLYLFPIKSLGPISVEQVEVEAAGLKGDRRFMLVDHQGKFITQRTRPDLTRFQLSLYPGGYVVSDQTTGLSKVLRTNTSLIESLEVDLWDDHLQVMEVGEGWSEWFSSILKEPVRLVKQVNEAPRQIPVKYQTDGSQQSSFADALPILMASVTSYVEVEQVYGSKIDPLRFRANILVSGSSAFEEDTWAEVSIQSVRLSGAKPCARCQLVNVEPSTGVIDKGGVLKALASFRQKDNKVYFGEQMVPITLGHIQVGDELHVLKRKDGLF